MYRLKKGTTGIVVLKRPFERINLEFATNKQLKRLFELGHPFVELEDKKSKENK